MLIILLSCLVFGVLLWLQRRRNKNEPPVLSRALPIIGHAHLVIGNITHVWNFLEQLISECLKNGGVASFHLGPIKIYGLTDPDDFLTVANTCLQKDNFYDFAKPWLGEGLITGTLPIWKIHRKLLNPAFNQIVLDGFLDVFNKQSRRLVKDFEIETDKKPFDHYTYIKNIALETICLTALGVDLSKKSELNSHYLMAVDRVFKIFLERAQKFWLHSNFIFSWSVLKRKQDECLKILQTMSYTILQKSKANYYLYNKNKTEEKGPKFKAFMQLLLELMMEKEVLKDSEIREEVDTMIAAGYETSATALTYCMVMIGSYPEVQKKVFNELYEVFGDDDRDVSKHDLSRLIYLEAVIKETLRLYPVVPVVARYLDRDVKLRNCTLSRGSRCFMFVYGVHRSSIWGSDAEEFKSERWLDPASLPSTAFVGFSAGKRNCIGKAYAFMSLKTTLAHIFRNYKVQGDHTKMELEVEVTLQPISGHHISIQRRNSKNHI